MSRSLWWLTVDSLAVYRLTVLLTKDTITAPFRERLGLPWSHPGIPGPPPYAGVRWMAFSWLSCAWCVSVWLAAGVVALTRFAPGAWQYAGMALALSGVAGYLAER